MSENDNFVEERDEEKYQVFDVQLRKVFACTKYVLSNTVTYYFISIKSKSQKWNDFFNEGRTFTQTVAAKVPNYEIEFDSLVFHPCIKWLTFQHNFLEKLFKDR